MATKINKKKKNNNNNNNKKNEQNIPTKCLCFRALDFFFFFY